MHARNLVRGATIVLATSLFVLGCAGRTTVPETPEPGSGPPAAPLDSETPAQAPASSPAADRARPESTTLSEGRFGMSPPTAAPGAKPAFDSLAGSLSPGFRSFYEDFEVAELALSHASDACSDACRALRSMVRAAERMCAIAASEPEELRCEAARDRVRGAREHVRRACHVCSEGPPLEDQR